MATSFIDSPFTTKKDFEAACALPAAERDATFRAAQSKAAGSQTQHQGDRGGGLLDAEGFFTREGGAPLLRRNAGFLTAEGISDGLRARLSGWPSLVGANAPAEEVSCYSCNKHRLRRALLPPRVPIKPSAGRSNVRARVHESSPEKLAKMRPRCASSCVMLSAHSKMRGIASV
jgi:hypothetical protein